MKAQRFALNHEYIEANSIAERYLRRELSAEQRAAFERHFVDCEECRDRLALAEMFLASEPEPEPEPPPPSPAIVVYRDPPPLAVWLGELQLWQVLAGIGVAALLLLSIPILLFLREQRHSVPVYSLRMDGETAIASGGAAVLVIQADEKKVFDEYRATLSCDSGGTRWMVRDLAARGALALSIQPDTLPAGRCMLRLTGVDRDGAEVPLRSFQLRVKPQ